MKESNHCPRCNGRLVSGVKNCLHCGSLVAPGKSAHASSSSGGGGGSILSMIIVVLAVVGLGGIILVGTGVSSGIDAVREGPTVIVSEPNVTATMCVPEGSDRLKDLGAEWEEIEGRDGMRCFRN